MHSLIWITGFVFAAVQAAPPGEVTNCDLQKFQSCTVGLANQLGPPFAATNMWIDPIQFRDGLNQIFVSGDITANVKVCNDLAMFYACLGDTLMTCLGVSGLVRQNMSPYMAYAYEGFMNMWRFQCGAGFYGSQKSGSDGCIRRTVQHYDTELKALLASYRSNVENHPGNACEYANDLSRKHQAVFAQGPCLQEQHQLFGGWWACEGQNEYTMAQFPECGIKNQCEYKSVHPAELAKHTKFVDGKLMVKIGATWTKNEKGELYEEPEKWI